MNPQVAWSLLRCFSSHEDLIKYIKNIALEQGFVSTIKRSCNKEKKLILGCDRGVKYHSTVSLEDDERKMKAYFLQCNCPFEVKGKQIVDGS